MKPQSMANDLCSVSEGICPVDEMPLSRTDGWCPGCRTWWTLIPPDGISRKFPFPGVREAPDGRWP